MKETRKKHLRTVCNWAVTICAAAVAVLAIIHGNIAYACWPIIAALFQWMASDFQGLAEDSIEYGDAMMMANLEQSRELCDAHLKIQELQEEIDRTRALLEAERKWNA